MKIAVLLIAALVSFWVVSAILGRFQKNPTRTTSSSHSRAGSEQASDIEMLHADPFEEACRVLQLDRPFTTEQLRAAYRQRMSQYHPDKVSNLGLELRELAETKSKEINRAFDLLARFYR